MELKFRTLKANEIEVRISQFSAKGNAAVLLYKDARVDMRLLDETVGPMNWQRSHSRDNANCTISIWDTDKNMWISKEDTGTESNTEAEKGLASDSYKRAGFNWGIGRELYSAPSIWIKPKSDGEFFKGSNGKLTTWTRFHVSEIDYDANRDICHLVISDQDNVKRFSWDSKQAPQIPPQVQQLAAAIGSEVKVPQSLPENIEDLIRFAPSFETLTGIGKTYKAAIMANDDIKKIYNEKFYEFKPEARKE